MKEIIKMYLFFLGDPGSFHEHKVPTRTKQKPGTQKDMGQCTAGRQREQGQGTTSCHQVWWLQRKKIQIVASVLQKASELAISIFF